MQKLSRTRRIPALIILVLALLIGLPTLIVGLVYEQYLPYSGMILGSLGIITGLLVIAINLREGPTDSPSMHPDKAPEE